MTDLTQNLDRLHTTPMSAERIRCNLGLQVEDVVAWCKDAIKTADIIIGQSKNWYVYKSGIVITVNAHSFTIITAHIRSHRQRHAGACHFDTAGVSRVRHRHKTHEKTV